MVKARRSTLVAAAVVLLFFLALTAVAYINALRPVSYTHLTLPTIYSV